MTQNKLRTNRRRKQAQESRTGLQVQEPVELVLARELGRLIGKRLAEKYAAECPESKPSEGDNSPVDSDGQVTAARP